MKKFLVFVFLAASIASCKKSAINPNNPSPVVGKKLTHSTVNGDATVEYNADGTPKRVTHTQGAYTYERNFSYAVNGKVSYQTNLQTASGWKKSDIGEYTLTNGKISTYVWTYYDAFENPIATHTETYVYNAQGLLERHNYANNVHKIFTYDAQGNMLESTYYNQGVAESKVVYTYGKDKELFPQFNWMTVIGEAYFLPAFSKNLLATQTGYDLLANKKEYENHFTYQLDADGYVKKGNVVDVVSAWTFDWTNDFQ